MRWVAPGSAGLRRVAPGCAGLRRVAPGCAGLRRVALGCAGLRRVAPGCAALFRVVGLFHPKISEIYTPTEISDEYPQLRNCRYTRLEEGHVLRAEGRKNCELHQALGIYRS